MKNKKRRYIIIWSHLDDYGNATESMVGPFKGRKAAENAATWLNARPYSSAVVERLQQPKKAIR